MSCQTCIHLDLSEKRTVSGCYQYGCNASQEGYISTWINKDYLLEKISCEFDQKGTEVKQMDIFDFIN